MPPRNQKTRPKQLKARLRDAEAVELRLAGKVYREIAEELGYADAGEAYHAVQRSIARVEAEGVEQLREVEQARLEKLHGAFWGDAVAGDGKAADRALRISERRSRLMGLDGPVKVEHSEVEDNRKGFIVALQAGDEVLFAAIKEALEGASDEINTRLAGLCRKGDKE